MKKSIFYRFLLSSLLVAPSYLYAKGEVTHVINSQRGASTSYVITGSAYKDDNKNSTFDSSEAGLANIQVTLYKDNNGDQTLQASDTQLATVDTDSTGQYSLVGLSNGNYLVKIDDTDNDIPSAYTLSTSNIIAVAINNASQSSIDFPFIPNKPTLLIDKTASYSSNTVQSGSQITYTITVTNNGTEDATGVKVIDVLSSDVTYISDDASGAYDHTTGLWTVGDVSQGSSKELNITVQVN